MTPDRPGAEGVLFLSIEDVLQVHQDTIQEEGGGRGVRDLGLLEAAVATPRQSFGGQLVHDDLASMAAAYLFHIAMNHPFVDGNKRAASFSAVIFLDLNGVTSLPNGADLEAVTLSVAAGEMSKEQLTVWFRKALAG